MSISAPIKARDGQHLTRLVHAHIRDHGRYCDLNHIDVSDVHTFDGVFHSTGFRGNVSQWNMSRAESTRMMFSSCPFNGDISQWDMSGVLEMESMFMGSMFAGDISRWHVRNARSMRLMFACNLAFDGDLSGWIMHPGCTATSMFDQNKPHRRSTQIGLALPLMSSTAPSIFANDDKRMHAYLARTPIGRYHWDALLEEPFAPWSTLRMRAFMDTAVPILGLRNEPGHYPKLSHALNKLWLDIGGHVPVGSCDSESGFYLEFATEH